VEVNIKIALDTSVGDFPKQLDVAGTCRYTQ